MREIVTMDGYYDPDLDRKYSERGAQLTTYRAEMNRRYDWHKGPEDGVYMFVKFATHNGTSVGVVEQAVVRSKRAISNLGGRFVGIARKIWDMNPNARLDEATVVFWFHSIKDARTFFVSDDRMKQPDFPAPAGNCEAWSVVRYYTPPNEHWYNTFMISEVQLARGAQYMDYKETFARRFAQLLLDYDAQPFVVQSVGAEDLRRFYVPYDTIITVHLFKDPAHLAEVRRDPRWNELASLHRQMTNERCSVFTIDPRACP